MTDVSAKRIFIGLNLSAEISKNIEPIVKKLKATADKKDIELRFSPKFNWHITLAFLGLTPLEKIVELKSLLAAFAHEQAPLEIHLRNLGGFPDVMGARVLWLGVAATKKLLSLHSDLEIHLEPWGYKGENRSYVPHVTIARLRNQKNITDLISPWVRKDFGKSLFSQVTLFESRPAGYFSTYEPLENYQLSRESTDVLPESEEDSN